MPELFKSEPLLEESIDGSSTNVCSRSLQGHTIYEHNNIVNSDTSGARSMSLTSPETKADPGTRSMSLTGSNDTGSSSVVNTDMVKISVTEPNTNVGNTLTGSQTTIGSVSDTTVVKSNGDVDEPDNKTDEKVEQKENVSSEEKETRVDQKDGVGAEHDGKPDTQEVDTNKLPEKSDDEPKCENGVDYDALAQSISEALGESEDVTKPDDTNVPATGDSKSGN